MKIRTLLASAAALALASCGGGNESETVTNTTTTTAADTGNMAADPWANQSAQAPQSGQEYATMAAASDMFEIESSRLAVKNAKSNEVKQFAQMLITDHEKSTRDLKAAAGQAQPAITVNPQMDAEQQSNIQALNSAGDQFDRTYLQQQVAAHQKALALVQGYAQNGDVPALKQHASTVSGPIQQHLQKAQQLSQSAGQ